MTGEPSPELRAGAMGLHSQPPLVISDRVSVFSSAGGG